jgi:hypothetical protein
MGINIKRKCFGLTQNNYMKVEDIVYSASNPFITHSRGKEIESGWEFTYRISLNKESRDIEKFISKFKNNEITITTKTKKEQNNLDNFLSGYNDQLGVGEVGRITIGLSKNKLLDKNHHPLFYGKSESDVYQIGYQISHEGRGYFGAKYKKDLEDDMESNDDFIKRMTKYVRDIISDNNDKGDTK